MLPKPEKSSKKISAEQLDLVDTLSDADKLKKKRLFILLSLFLTVGLSLCFFLYRYFQSFDFRTIKLPQVTINLPRPTSSFSPEVPSTWSLFVQSIGNTDFSYSANFTSSDFKQLTRAHDPSYAKKYLPDGVVTTEKINFTSDFSEILTLISTPQKKFKIYVKIPGKIDNNSPEIDTYAQLVSSFYWYLLK